VFKKADMPAQIATSHLHRISNIDITISVGIQESIQHGFAPPWDSEHRYQFGADSKPELGWADRPHSTRPLGSDLFSWLEKL